MLSGTNVDVLIVGAGPVGLAAALQLAELGKRVGIIDAAERTAARSYACVLHSRTLEMLDRFGLAGEALEWGHRIDTIGFYEGASRRAELRTSELGGRFPCLVVLPQSALEWILERALKQFGGIAVKWRHRFLRLRPEEGAVIADVENLEQIASGNANEKSAAGENPILQFRADFLIGADGKNSQVRRCLGIECEPMGEPEHFAVFEFGNKSGHDGEARVVFDGGALQVVWPISEERWRWSFQLETGAISAEFPSKNRNISAMDEPAADESEKNQLRQLIQQRAPWFQAKIDKFHWAQQVHFERRLAQRFSQGRCWLIGDAAHQTSPVGVQSLNVGLCEARELADLLKDLPSGDVPPGVRENWERRRRQEWRQLFGQDSSLGSTDRTDDWVRSHAGKLLSCVPASGAHLASLLNQLQLTLA